MQPKHTIETPASRAGAIAVIRIEHADPIRLGLPSVPPGGLRLADLFGIDEGLILRTDDTGLLVMPHGGAAIVRKISAELRSRGVPHSSDPDPPACYPEAESEIEAWMLAVLSRAASPDAVDVLLDAGARWRDRGICTIADAEQTNGWRRDGPLGRLVHPPAVVAVGRANIGKSTLVNTLAGRSVALVADLPGTTRDHVGVMINLAGLAVRWVDMPGIDARIGNAPEIAIGVEVARRADLIVHCIDAGDERGALDPRIDAVIPPSSPVVRVGLRADLGQHRVPVDVAVSLAEEDARAAELVEHLREVLLPAEAMEEATPWAFWRALGA